MKLFKYIFLICIASFLLLTCGDDNSAPVVDPEPLEFTTEPSSELSQLIETTPSDFTWDHFNSNITVSVVPGSMWSGEIVLSSFQVENGEVVSRVSSSPVETSISELADGPSTEELFQGSEWVPGAMWFPESQGNPASQWMPGSGLSPSEIEANALSEFDLNENESLIVVYARLADDSLEREQTTQPYGLIMQEEEAATGQLDVMTETWGDNADDSFQVTVNDTTETIGANSSMIFTDLPVGDHEVELSDIADNCEVVAGENPRTVTIQEETAISTLFEVQCQEVFKGLAFTSFGDGNANIHTIEEDGSNRVQLTSHSEFDGQSAISPGGTKIAFTSERDGNREIYVMNSDGSNLNRLTNNPELDEHPAWSPDGSQIVFSSQRDGVDELYTMDSDGSNVNRVTNSSSLATSPDWSPDGERIVFVSLRDNEWKIFSITTEGTDETKLADNEGTGVDRAPEWSPDGTEIAFHSNRSGNNEIYRMDADGSNITQVTSSSGSEPTWSPTGNHIAFESVNLYVINRDGSNLQNLTETAAFDEHPSWSRVE